MKITEYGAYCKIGMSATTNVFIAELEANKYEARMGFSLFGATNMSEKNLKLVSIIHFIKTLKIIMLKEKARQKTKR